MEFNSKWSYTYDQAGHLASKGDVATNGNQVLWQYGYNHLGELTRAVNQREPSPGSGLHIAQVIDYRYDAEGNRVDRRQQLFTPGSEYSETGIQVTTRFYLPDRYDSSAGGFTDEFLSLELTELKASQAKPDKEIANKVNDMQRFLAISILFLAIFQAGCGPIKPVASTPQEPDSTLKPTKVEIFRIESETTTDLKISSIASYPIISQGKDLPAEFGERLNAIVLSEKVTPNKKKCGFEPGVAFRVWYGGKANDILICFKCDVLWSKPKDVEPKFPTHEWKDFDPARSDLLKLAKEAFPDDKDIQGIKEKRE